MIPLFEQYPGVYEHIPHVSLATLPTPVQSLPTLGKALGLEKLYVKRDDYTGPVYGGNKPRILEFALGKAVHRGKKTILTFGAAGSTHTLATALYAKQLGLNTICMLMPQANAHYLRRNLLLTHLQGAEFHHYPNIPIMVAGALVQLARLAATGRGMPCIIPPGGSNALGVLGHVNAALELARQVKAGELPEPDVLYVACGSMGTSVGLALGVSLAGLRTRIMAIRVTPMSFVSLRKAKRFFQGANRLLSNHCSAIPTIPFSLDTYNLRHDYFGEEYALFTRESMQAVHMAADTENLKLEGTYTGKAFAALIGDARAGHLKDKTVLFWNTTNSNDFSKDIAHLDYHALPKSLHHYFEEDVQPLDRA
ncbi:MAG TPA: pyridoxal-phosphate dependent enzyme [Candidatus Hydrogenedentes bacterium]|nr:pyridoxal-phosphate dependent enzyme [Candidatus Hydrogenedentota bacterium]